MKNKDLILRLVDKSINAFGQIHGLTKETKLKTALTVLQSTIQDSLETNSRDLSEKTLADILANGKLDLEQARLLTSLLWAEAELFQKLNLPDESLVQYENTLQLLHWKSAQTTEKISLEREIKISQLILIIISMKEAGKINKVEENKPL